MSSLKLILRNPANTSEQMELVVDLFLEKNITKKWLEALKENLKKKLHLDKNFCFLGFPQENRDVNFLCKKLEKHRQVINEYYKNTQYKNSIFIAEKFEPNYIIKNGKLNQDAMNRLHHYFEVLSGQVWNPSEYIKEAPLTVKYAIRSLNLICHELESLLHQYRNYTEKQLNEKIFPSIIYSLLGAKRIELSNEDLSHFEFDRDFGLVSLHYCQIGKRWDEAFEDKDEHIFDSGISGLRYFTGEFNISWEHYKKKPFKQKEMEIREWIASKGHDPHDPALGLGWIYVGRIDKEKNFPGLSIEEIHSNLLRHLDIYKVIVEDQNETICQTFNYTNLDRNYDEMQMSLI